MKISICITYYNQKDFVRQSLDSVFAIEFPCDFEILCGDDGSTDGTIDIIKEYALKYPDNIKYFVSERTETAKSINRASLNRLNLAKNATGDYIMFLDGDDYYCDKTFVKEALDVFENNKDVEVCAFNFAYLHTDNSQEIFKQNIKEGFIDVKEYISKGAYTPSGACVFKNILDKEKLELLNKINNFDDNAITIYFLQFGDLYYFDKPIYMYRQSENSLWHNFNEAEKNIWNALDYKLTSTMAPMFNHSLIKRLWRPLKYLYKHKKRLISFLNDKRSYYLNIAEKNNDTFVLNLLKWNELNILQKIKTYYEYRKLKKDFYND